VKARLALAAWQIVALLNLPMVLLIAYTAGRAWRLLPLPIVGVAFAALGVAAVGLRLRAGARMRVDFAAGERHRRDSTRAGLHRPRKRSSRFSQPRAGDG
jgi:hypothetical protein